MDSASSLFANLAFVGSQDRAMFVKVWRDGRVAEGGGLLSRYTVKSRIGGSNPPLSARSGTKGPRGYPHPMAENPRLAHGTAEQLSRIEISPYGNRWPDLDEDLSFRGLLRGDYGQHQNAEPNGPRNES